MRDRAGYNFAWITNQFELNRAALPGILAGNGTTLVEEVEVNVPAADLAPHDRFLGRVNDALSSKGYQLTAIDNRAPYPLTYLFRELNAHERIMTAITCTTNREANELKCQTRT